MCAHILLRRTDFLFATASTLDSGLHITNKLLKALNLDTLSDKTINILGHPWTEGLPKLIDSLLCQGATVHLFGFQPREIRAEEVPIILLCQGYLGKNMHLKDPLRHVLQADMIVSGQCLGTIVIANADILGILLALKSIGLSHYTLDADTCITSRQTPLIMNSLIGMILERMCANILPLGNKAHASSIETIVKEFAVMLTQMLNCHQTGISLIDTPRGFSE